MFPFFIFSCQDHEKARRKRAPTSNTEETVRVESSSAVQSHYVDVRVVSDPTLASITQQNRFSSLASTAPMAAPINTSISSSLSISCTNAPHLERMNQEKVKVNHDQPIIDGRPVNLGAKKKVKKRAENVMGGLPLRPQKLPSHQGDDKHKHKHVSGQIQAAPHNSSYNEFRFEPLT